MNSQLLGKTGRDKVSGFSGIITAHATYLDGQDRVEITSRVKNGEVKSIWLDRGRVLHSEPKKAAAKAPRKSSK